MALKFTKLTKANTRKLEPDKMITEHGIEFKRLINGDGLYQINIMVNGTRIHRSIGKESDNTTRAKVEQALEEIKSNARNNRLNLPKGRKLALGLSAAGDKYISKLKESDGKNIDKKDQQFRLHIKPFSRINQLIHLQTLILNDIKSIGKHLMRLKPPLIENWRH